MSNQNPPIIHTKVEIHLWWLTAVIIAINVALFSWQVITGMDVSNPSSADAIRWGADYAPLTFLAEPFRLLSSMFFHFGLIHLMLNMWALYIFGSVVEQLFGRWYFLGFYILAGLSGSLLSGYLSIQDSYTLLSSNTMIPELLPRVGAGASGAVMGLGASLTLLAILPPLARQKFILDKKTLIIVMAINLSMGFMISGINNAAHIGGMLMGLMLTFIWYFGQKFNKSKLFTWLGIILGSILCYFSYQYCLAQIEYISPLWQALLEHLTN